MCKLQVSSTAAYATTPSKIVCPLPKSCSCKNESINSSDEKKHAAGQHSSSSPRHPVVNNFRVFMSIDYHVFTQGGKPIFSLPLNRKKQLVSTSQEIKSKSSSWSGGLDNQSMEKRAIFRIIKRFTLIIKRAKRATYVLSSVVQCEIFEM